MNLREEIIKYSNDEIMPEGQTPQEIADTIISMIEKRIDKVEQDYKSELNNWGKKQPMKDMYPREMTTLEKVRKELV